MMQAMRHAAIRSTPARRSPSIAIGILLIAGCLGACPLAAKTLRFASGFDPQSLDPHALALQYQTRVVSQIYESLVFRDRNFTMAPALAVSWQQLGPERWRFKLRPGVKFHDGVPFTADDVVFSTKAVLNMANNEVSREGWNLITKIDEPDKYTVVYHLKKKYAAYAGSYFGSAGANPCVLPVHLLGKLPNINNAPYNALPVGIGPFKYASWKRSDSVTMVPDPLYFRGKPKLQKILFKIVPDRNTVTTQLETHEIDLWTPVAAAFYDRVKAIPGVAVKKQPSYTFNHLDFQNQHPGLDDPRVRRALRMGIDRQEIVQKIRHGIGIVQDDPVSPANPAFDKAVPTDPFDLAAAAKLLDEAGWKPGPDGIRAKNGHAMNYVFASTSGTPDADSTIELIRANWK